MSVYIIRVEDDELQWEVALGRGFVLFKVNINMIGLQNKKMSVLFVVPYNIFMSLNIDC